MPSRTNLPKFESGQRRVSARSLNALVRLTKQLDRQGAPFDPRKPQHMIEAQASIAAGATGDVKLAYWDADGSSIETWGDSFTALNIGPDTIASGEHAMIAMGERGLPFFPFGKGGAVGVLDIGSYKFCDRTADYTDASGAVWMVCNGDAISRTTYATYFTLVGTRYGNGDGSSTFNIADAKNRYICATGSNMAIGDTDGQLEANRDPETHGHPDTFGVTEDDVDLDHDHNCSMGWPSSYQGATSGTDFNAADDTHTHSGLTDMVSGGLNHNHNVTFSGSITDKALWPPHLGLTLMIRVA
jgi:microcystin-dependent protein